MPGRTIVGRHAELAILNALCESREAQFLVVYGRRRIGKTFLLSEFFRPKGLYFEITGRKDGTLAAQLFHFTTEFATTFLSGETIAPPRSWTEAFHLLKEAVKAVDPSKKVILFFDEVPWLASRKSGFLPALEHCWNRYLSRHPNVIVIVCGSAASWIIKNILYNKGGLHGRVTQHMRLMPFTLAETEAYLQSRGIDLDRKQIIDLYMAVGGVPKYLSYVKRGQSAAQAINEMCFTSHGGLLDEFHKLYQSLFDHHDHHIRVVSALAAAASGLTKDVLLVKAELTSGGTSSKVIQDLIDSGFIVYMPPCGHKTGGLYRLIDEYSLFYLRWAKGVTSSTYWLHASDSPAWRAWSGCAFESICLKHVAQIKQALGISGISTTESGWRYVPSRKSRERGAQIDLVIDRSDRCINLCEMKYVDAEFVMDKAYAAVLQEKKQLFREQMHPRKALFCTLVTTYGAKKNAAYLAAVDALVTMEALFMPTVV